MDKKGNFVNRNEFQPLSNNLNSMPSVEKSCVENNAPPPSQDWMLPLTSFTERNRPDVKKDKQLSRALRKFYISQNDHISDCERVYKDIICISQSTRQEFHDSDDAVEDDTVECEKDSNKASDNEKQKMASKLAQLSLFCNIILLCSKSAAAGLSGSLTIISSLVDSAVDLASGIVVWATSRAVRRRNTYRYPQGRTRLEPVAIVVLSVIMAVASMQIILVSVQKISALALDKESSTSSSSDCLCVSVSNSTNTNLTTFAQSNTQSFRQQLTNSNLVVLILVAATVVVKLILYIVCVRFGETPAVEALAQDHRNDVISNTAVFICTIISGLLWVYADPVGAIVIGIYIVYTWTVTCWGQIKVLTGHTADPAFLRLVTLIAFNHHETVKQVDTVRAFHHGTNYLVEVDIVLPEDMTVRHAHDVAESLQQKIELLENVERAFVHIDYEVSHDPRSEHKQV